MCEATPRQTLPPAARVRSRKAFVRAFGRRIRASDDRILVHAAPNDAGLARLGISVGRRLGNAVRRNRLKRLVREAFRRVRFHLPSGTDYIVIPRPGPEPTVTDLRQSLVQLARRLHTRVENERQREAQSRAAEKPDQARSESGGTRKTTTDLQEQQTGRDASSA